MADRSVSRILSCACPKNGLRAGTIIPLGHASLRGSCSLPEGHLPSLARRGTGRTSPPLLFGLAPRGVYRASSVAARAVGSYPTFSPLPDASRRNRTSRGLATGRSPCGIRRRYFLCGTFRGIPIDRETPWRYQARCPAESGLSSRPSDLSERPAIVRPARLFVIIPPTGRRKEGQRGSGPKCNAGLQPGTLFEARGRKMPA